MFPGFVDIYKDLSGYVHLYFFSGIDEDGKDIYKNIDLSNIPFTYVCSKSNEDTTFDYKFDNKSIVKIKCQLVENKTNKIEKILLSLKKDDRISTKI